MEPRPLPSECSPEEARMRAAQYRQMAAEATSADVKGALLRLAEKYEALAAKPERGGG